MKNLILSAAVLALTLTVGTAQASVVKSYQFNGKGNWSIDGVGSNNTPVGDISAIVPLGSTVEKAFLYSSTYTFGGPVVPTVDFDGTVINAWTDLGFAATCCGLKAFRADVTSQVAGKIGGGSAVPFTFSILRESPNGNVDGEALAIVYSNPAEKERTIAFLDGNTAAAGDAATINLASPLTAGQLADSAFESLMSLGIGFSFRPSAQYSQVDVNGSRLTSDAGGQDDGIPPTIGNGGLITIGGIGDNPANPADPFASNTNNPLIDDELYTLTPFLAAGMNSIHIKTRNPSNDDNIFFTGFNITAQGDVVVPGVPEPSTILLLGTGLVGLVGFGWRRRS